MLKIWICFVSLFYFKKISIKFSLFDYSVMIEWELLIINSNCYKNFIGWMFLLFMGFVFFISSMVVFYNKKYMFGDLNINRFIMLVLMCVLSMMLLIISPNLISILLGWDGLSLVSYCLVILMITSLVNRSGDLMLLILINKL